MKFKFVRDHQHAFDVYDMCHILKVSRSGYYGWRNRPKSKCELSNERLLIHILAAYRKGRKSYGSPKITKELKEQGISCSKNRVARLMHKHNIKSKYIKRYKVTTRSNHSFPIHDNLLNQQFKVNKPNKVWVSDITYIRTINGWLYLAIILDLFSRKIVGWSIRNHLKAELVISAFKNAVKQRKPPSGLIFHSDRGIQYACTDFQNLLETYGMQCSMSKKGDCYDNACAESFFHVLKTELIHEMQLMNQNEIESRIFEYIEIFYNRIRRHSTINYLSPVAFELKNVA